VRLLVVGTDHQRAGVELRERIALAGAALERALTYLSGLPEIAEVVVLSTCNRTEIYAVPTGEGAAEAITGYLAASAGLDHARLAETLVVRQGQAALRHLCSVASGLQSMALAESQVASQVRVALQVAREQRTVGPELGAVFDAALRCGKRVRTETELGRANTSIAHVAVARVRQIRPDLATCRVLLVGAGKMNTVAAGLLRDAGVGQLTVVSRTLAAATDLAALVGGAARPLDELTGLLAEADVVITAARTAQPLITEAMLRAARPSGSPPLLIADLAVPRNVAAHSAELPGVTVLDLDSLHADLGVAQGATDDLRRAAQIVDEVAVEAAAAARIREAAPVLAALRAHVDHSKEAELARTLADLEHLAPHDREAVALLAHRLVGKMFHHLAARMRNAAADPEMEGYLPVARYLFGVDERHHVPHTGDSEGPAGSAERDEPANAAAYASLVGSQG